MGLIADVSFSFVVRGARALTPCADFFDTDRPSRLGAQAMDTACEGVRFCIAVARNPQPLDAVERGQRLACLLQQGHEALDGGGAAIGQLLDQQAAVRLDTQVACTMHPCHRQAEHQRAQLRLVVAAARGPHHGAHVALPFGRHQHSPQSLPPRIGHGAAVASQLPEGHIGHESGRGRRQRVYTSDNKVVSAHAISREFHDRIVR